MRDEAKTELNAECTLQVHEQFNSVFNDVSRRLRLFCTSRRGLPRRHYPASPTQKSSENTYGQIAALAGLSGRARQVGYALHALPDGSDVPWQRVINAKGEVSPRSHPGWENYQRHLLEEEGVEFDGRGRIDLDHFRWDPDG